MELQSGLLVASVSVPRASAALENAACFSVCADGLSEDAEGPLFPRMVSHDRLPGPPDP